MRSLVTAIALVVLLAGCESKQAPKPPSPQPQQGAQDALGVLQKLVNEQNYRAMGFDSVDEVKQAQLSQPLTVMNIPLDRLKSYQAGGDTQALLVKSSETIYPVTVNGQVKSSVTIVQSDAGYAPASFGNAPIIRALSQYRQGPTPESDFVVRVPALNMYFLGRTVDGKLMLVPIAEDPRLKLRPGEAVPFETALPDLVAAANAYNGLPM